MIAKKVHFVGIGGIGMSGIAEILLRSGYRVSGSDLRENTETEHLKTLGAKIFRGHSAEHLGDANVVVVSSAIARDNPEIMEAKRRSLAILPRAEMLAELMRMKRSIVVAGAHGKTTTSAMIATLLLESGFDPTAVIGGRLRRIASNAKVGTDEWFVAESDESDGSFLHLLPTIAAITNIDREHLSHYGLFENLEKAFIDFANRVPLFDGLVILCRDDPSAAGILPRIERTTWTYGIHSEADVKATEVQLASDHACYTLVHHGKKVTDITLPLTGKHNVLNSLAAASVGIHLGLTGKKIAAGLHAFAGIERRLDAKGEASGIRVIDDYAHHPTEIRATLEALRLMADGGALRVMFQPHRFTRLRDLWDDFVAVFDATDELVVLPVYAASESPISGIDHHHFVKEIRSRGRTDARAAQSLEEGAQMLTERATKGDLLITMGAGDVTKGGSHLLSILRGTLSLAGRKK